MDEVSSSSNRVKELVSLRAKIMTKLENVEQDIADAELEYLEETDHGNIVKGFEGSQNRKVRVRARDRIFSRSSTSCPLPPEEDMPFQSNPQVLEAMMYALTGVRPMTSLYLPLNVPDEKQVVANQLGGRRRRNTVAGSEGNITAPITPSATKAEKPTTGGPVKRSTRRRK